MKTWLHRYEEVANLSAKIRVVLADGRSMECGFHRYELANLSF